MTNLRLWVQFGGETFRSQKWVYLTSNGKVYLWEERDESETVGYGSIGTCLNPGLWDDPRCNRSGQVFVYEWNETGWITEILV